MACPKYGKKRKRLPSINPFFHFLKCVWKKFKGCRKSVVLRFAVKKWKCMTRSQRQPYYEAACKAQRLHRKAKKCPKPKKPKCPKQRAKPKPKCPKQKAKEACHKKKPEKKDPCRMPSPPDNQCSPYTFYSPFTPSASEHPSSKRNRKF